jgi:CheY-like chemotaxis protein
LLTFSRRQVIQMKKIDLNEVVRLLIKMLRRLIGEDISLDVFGSQEPLWIEADVGMIEQVIMNLCVNARDAMSGGGHLIIATRVVEFDEDSVKMDANAREGRFACLEVSDTGCGITEENMQKIFDPFFTTKEVGKGTGLGLATVHGIVKQHDGWVKVQSVVGQGSSFSIYLPACEPSVVEEPSPMPAGPLLCGGKETILLVEDDQFVRQMITMNLQPFGYKILEAGNGKEALHQWEQYAECIDLLLTDMVMPGGMTGLELAQQLRLMKPELKVIISTGYSMKLLEPGALKDFEAVYLVKPFEAGKLIATVRQCLDSQ